MRRTASPSASIRCSNREVSASVRNWTLPVFVAVAVIAVPIGSVRGGDDGPELSPPLDAPASAIPPRLVNPLRPPIVSTPLAVRPPPTPLAGPVAPADGAAIPAPLRSPGLSPNAVLALPGLSVRGANSRLPALPALGDVPVEEAGAGKPRQALGSASELTLDGPVEMPSLPPKDMRARPGDGSDLAPIADTAPDDRRTFDPLPGPSTRRSSVSTSRIEPTPPGNRSASASNPAPTPARQRRFFGLFAGPVIPPTALNSRPTTQASRDLRQAHADLDPQAAAEAALKTRIEKQARTSVGDRARAIEVQVSEKTATVQARGVKFYQKRAVRKSLETLPALSGLRSTIEVLD